MKALFLGGDKRQLEIINNLKAKNIRIDTLGYKNINVIGTRNLEIKDIKVSDYDLIFFPVNGLREDFNIYSTFTDEKIHITLNFLSKAKESALIFTGVKTGPLKSLLAASKKECIALMEDPNIKIENSIPTSEGIIGDLIYNTDHTINNSKIFVIGYGNVGKTLVDKLSALGANICVGVIEKEDYREIKEKKLRCIYTNHFFFMEDVIKNSDVIINTVPSPIFKKNELEQINKNTYLIDVSSSPHGIDFKAAEELNINTKLLPGIPGKVAPKTAGKILVKKINSIIKEDENR